MMIFSIPCFIHEATVVAGLWGAGVAGDLLRAVVAVGGVVRHAVLPTLQAGGDSGPGHAGRKLKISILQAGHCLLRVTIIVKIIYLLSCDQNFFQCDASAVEAAAAVTW